MATDSSNGVIPANSVVRVEVNIGIHNTLKALKSLVETLDADRLYEGMAADLETLADRIRERLGVGRVSVTFHGLEPGNSYWLENRASGPSGISQELKAAYTFPDHAVVPQKIAEFHCNGEYLERWEDQTPDAMSNFKPSTMERLKRLYTSVLSFADQIQSVRFDSSKPNVSNPPKPLSQPDGYVEPNDCGCPEGHPCCTH